MIIKYEFLTGETIEIDVKDEIAETVFEIEKNAFNSDRKETRRHSSFHDVSDKSEILIDESMDVEAEIVRKNDIEILHKAISLLKPQEKELLYRLYLCEQSRTQAQLAAEMGISENAIKQRVKHIRSKLKLILEQL